MSAAGGANGGGGVERSGLRVERCADDWVVSVHSPTSTLYYCELMWGGGGSNFMNSPSQHEHVSKTVSVNCILRV